MSRSVTAAAVNVAGSSLQKLEAPLRDLWFGGGDKEISTTAFIEMRGRDLTGNVVAATASMQVFFADFADE